MAPKAAQANARTGEASLGCPSSASSKPSLCSFEKVDQAYLPLRSLIIDGLTNSTQDQLFTLHPRFKGQQLMFNMSLLSLCMTLPFLVLPPHTVALLSTILPSPLHALVADPVSHHATESLAAPLFQSLQFLHEHPTALLPLFAYALLGGLGQLFIFETISHFGSLTLVMVTVTRKLVTMLLSVVVFGHRLRAGQWVGVAVVFLGIGVEAGMKRRGEYTNGPTSKPIRLGRQLMIRSFRNHQQAYHGGTAKIQAQSTVAQHFHRLVFHRCHMHRVL